MTKIVRLLFILLSCVLKLSYMSSYNTLVYIIHLFLLNIFEKIHNNSLFALVLGFEGGKGIKGIQTFIPSLCVARLFISRPTSKMVVL